MPIRFLDEEPKSTGKIRFLDEPQESNVDYGKFAARSAADIASGAVGAPLDLVKSTISDPILNRMYAPTESYTSQIRSGIDNLTGGYTKTPTEEENIADNRRFAASILGFGGAMNGLASKGAQIGSTALESVGNALGTTTKTGALADAGSVAGYSLADKDNETGKLIGSVAGSLAGGGVGGLANSLRNSKEALAGVASKGLGINKGNIRTDVIKDAEELGIELPLSAQTKSTRAQSVEGTLSKLGVGSAYSEKFERLNKGAIDAFRMELDNVGAPSTNIGEVTQNALQRRIKGLESQTAQRYDSATKLIPNGDVTPTNNTLQYLDDSIKKLSGSLAPADAEKGVVGYLQDLRGALANGADPKRLLQTKVSVNSQVDYDAFRGAEKVLKGIAPAINKDIAEYGQKNPEFYKAFTQAENAFKSEVLPTRTKVVQSILSKDPSQILSTLNSPKAISILEQSLGTTQTGKGLVQSIKRAKLEELLEQKIITQSGTNDNSALQRFNFGNFVRELDPRSKQAALVKKLVGDEQFNQLQKLRNVSGAVVDASKFVNYSNTASRMLDVSLAMAGGASLATGNVPGMMAVASPYVASKVMTNPDIVKAMINLQTSASKGNVKGVEAQSQVLMKALKNAGLSELTGD